MRISLSVLALVAACGGARARDGKAISDCDGYQAALRPSLARMSRAADRFAPEDGARSGRELAASLDAERATHDSLTVAEPTQRRAHADLVASLAEMTRALAVLAEVLDGRDETRREEARRGLEQANQRWERSVHGLRAVCPGVK